MRNFELERRCESLESSYERVLASTTKMSGSEAPAIVPQVTQEVRRGEQRSEIPSSVTSVFGMPLNVVGQSFRKEL